MPLKHTPGPWQLDQDGEFVRAHGFAVCQMYLPCDPEDETAFDQQAANARLIAAAPDMLGVLIQIHAWAVRERRSGNLAIHVEEVIAKATGQ